MNKTLPITISIGVFFCLQNLFGQTAAYSSLRGNGLNFIQNKGQIVDLDQNQRPDILFRGAGAGADVYLRKSGISYVLSNIADVKREAAQKAEEETKKINGTEHDEQNFYIKNLSEKRVKLHRVDMDFLNCNLNPQITSSDEVEGYKNYYLASCPEGIINVHSFNEVYFANIYDKIDVKYYGGKSTGLKYDIIVNPGGNPESIQLKYSGAEEVSIVNGELRIRNSLGELIEQLPKVYQNINGKIKDIKAKYILERLANNVVVVHFSFKNFNSAFPLVIDPWVTYLGGPGGDDGTSVNVDRQSNVIITGYSTLTGFPVTAGASQSAYGGGTGDAFIAKMTASGNAVFITYFGGSASEWGYGISADDNNNILVVGSTGSANMPTKSTGGAYTQTFSTAFIAEFTPAGALTWSTFFGGNSFNGGADLNDVCCDHFNNIFVSGTTSFTNQPVLNAYQASLMSGTDICVAKFNSNGILQWSTYYGGSGADMGFGITCDAANNLFFCGSTYSTNFPTTTGAFQPSLSAGVDGVLVKLNPATGFPVWSTYFGGNAFDSGIALATDNLGNIILTGSTVSTNISTPGAFQTSPNNVDAYVAKFNPTGNLLWCTYMGGSSSEEASGVAVDAQGNIVVTGDTYSADLPSTPCAYQSTFQGTEDQYIVTFDPTGKMVCCGYIGIGDASTPNNETQQLGGSVAVDGCFLYLVASSLCAYPVTSNAYQYTCGSVNNDDAVLSKLYISTCGGTASTLDFTSDLNSVCTGQPVNFSSTYKSCFDTTGNVAYTWIFQGGTPGSSTTQNPSGISYNAPGKYDVKLVVQLPCGLDSLIKTQTITVTNGFTLTSDSTQSGCNTNNGTASVSTTGGSGLSYSWSNGQTSVTAMGLAAGTYTVTVSNTSGCKISRKITVTSANAPKLAVDSIRDVKCVSQNTGKVYLSASGGTNPYSFSWSNGFTSFNSTQLVAGSYTVTVKDAGGCMVSTSISITEPGPLVVNPSVQNGKCQPNTGSATITASGGVGGFTYSWSNAATGQTINNLTKGTYTVTVSDLNGCTISSTVVLTNSSNPIATVSITTGILCNGGKGNVTASASGGDPGYSYSWSNGSFATTTAMTDQLTSVSAANYTVTVTDANSCTSINSINLTEPPPIILNAPLTTNANCASSTGTAITSATGGTGTLTYSWSPGTSGQTANNLNAGTYTVIVNDANGCSKSTTAIISNNGGPAITSVNSVNNMCVGQTAGQASVSISGGSTPYTYSWSMGTSSITSGTVSQISNLSSQTYSVTITDANNCLIITSVVVTDPPPIGAATFTTSNSTCGGNNGSAVITLSGGTGNFNFSWSNSASGATAQNLSATTYTVTATDANNCSKVSLVTINNTNGPLVSMNIATPIKCNGGTGAIAASVSGGTNPFTYNWANAGVNGSGPSGLSAGIYSLTVIDKNGCTTTSSLSLPEPPVISGPILVASNTTCGNSNGTVTATSSGGSGALTYSWSNSGAGTPLTGLSVGVYTLTVADGNGCTKTGTTAIGNANGPGVFASIANPIPCYQGNGNVLASVTGGSLPYTYSWSNGLSAITTSSNHIITVLANSYTVTTTDANNCSSISAVTLTDPPLINTPSFITTNTSCQGSSGSAVANASGGSGTLTYSWSVGASGATISGLAVGNYTVTVLDGNACTTTGIATINNTNGPSILSVTSVDINCYGGNSGSASITVANGTAPYTYSWSNGATVSTGSQSNQLSNLTANTYTVVVTDAGGCKLTSIIKLTEPLALKVNVTTTDEECGNSNGTASSFVSGGTAIYTYLWNNGFTQASQLNLDSGTYILTVTDSKGCVSGSLGMVKTIPKGTINISPAQQTIVEGGSVALSAFGASAFTWSPATGLSCTNCYDPVANPVVTTTYTITALDLNGCTISAMLTIVVRPGCSGEDSDIFIANVFSPNNDGKNDVLKIEGNGLTNIYWGIYDRWGNLIYETFDQNSPWDGTKRGNAMESGTYVYYLKATCLKTNSQLKLKGNVSIVK